MNIIVRKNRMMEKVSVFSYTDFRAFIKDRYQFIKSRDRTMTYKKLGKSVGFSSPGFFTQIIQGKSRLPASMVDNLCRALELTVKEQAYFKLLAEFGQTETHARKHELFKKLINMNTGTARTLTPEQYVVFDKWYYTAIHELLHYTPFNGDFHALAKRLAPPISPAEAREAIALLLHLKMIGRNEQGVFVRSDAEPLTTGFHPESVAINNYLLEMMKLAERSVETSPKEARSLSTLTVSVSENGYHRLEQELHEFRRRLLTLAKQDRFEDRLYQINLQMFPLTKIEKKESASGAGERGDGTIMKERPCSGQ